MAWFTPIKDTYNISSELSNLDFLNIPVKREISINYLSSDIEQNEQIYVNLDNKFVNKYINSSLEEVVDNYSYLVVLQDRADDEYFVPVKSRAVGNILYFNAVEKITKNTFYTKYYVVYYGITNIKFLEEITIDDEVRYRKLAPEVIIQAEGTYFDLASVDIQEYSYDATEISSKEYKLALYNNGLDWIDGKSEKIGAKAFGSFDGPKFRLIGKKGPNYGKFKIRIFSYYDDNSISKNLALDWVTIDCYANEEASDQVLYSNSNLEYAKYIFELEVLSEKNVMSSSNSIKLTKYQFSPNYNLTYSAEEINPNIAFIKIGGIR
jgi:hypothetical protein